MSDGIPILNQEEPKCVSCTVCGWVLDTRGECTVCGGVSREESFTRVDFYRKGYEAGLDSSSKGRIASLESMLQTAIEAHLLSRVLIEGIDPPKQIEAWVVAARALLAQHTGEGK